MQSIDRKRGKNPSPNLRSSGKCQGCRARIKELLLLPIALYRVGIGGKKTAKSSINLSKYVEGKKFLHELMEYRVVVQAEKSSKLLARNHN